MIKSILCTSCGSLWITQKQTKDDFGCLCSDFETPYHFINPDQLELPFSE